MSKKFHITKQEPFTAEDLDIPAEEVESSIGEVEQTVVNIDKTTVELNSHIAHDIQTQFNNGLISHGEALSMLLNIDVTPAVKDVMTEVVLGLLEWEKKAAEVKHDDEMYSKRNAEWKFTVIHYPYIPNHPELAGTYGIACAPTKPWGVYPWCYSTLGQATDIRDKLMQDHNFTTFQVNFHLEYPILLGRAPSEG